MNLPNLKAYNRHHHSDLGHFFRPEEQEEEPRYNLRSHQIIGDFLVIHNEAMCHPTVAEAAQVSLPPRSNRKPILSKNTSTDNDIMMDNIMDYVSGDQLPSLMAGIQFHIDLASEYRPLHESAERYKYKKLVQSYKRGQLRQNLSHKLTMKDVQPVGITSEKK